jgi:hypothetical protein
VCQTWGNEGLRLVVQAGAARWQAVAAGDDKSAGVMEAKDEVFHPLVRSLEVLQFLAGPGGEACAELS